MKNCLWIDFDGVLAQLARTEAEEEIQKRGNFLLVHPSELLDRLFYSNPHTRDIDSGQMSYHEMLSHVAPAFWSGPIEEWHGLWHSIWDHYQPNTEILALLQYWQQRQGMYVVVTDNHRDFRAWMSAHRSFGQFAENLLCSAEKGVTKPSREFFEAAKHLSGVSFVNSVFIDDNPRNVEHARQLGVTSFLFESGHSYNGILAINPKLTVADLIRLVGAQQFSGS